MTSRMRRMVTSLLPQIPDTAHISTPVHPGFIDGLSILERFIVSSHLMITLVNEPKC